MRRLPAFVALALFAVVPPAVVACGGDEKSTTNDPHPSPPLTPTSTGNNPPDPGPTSTTTTPPTQEPPPEPEWVPPVVPTRSAACGTPKAQPLGTEYLTPASRKFHVWGPPGYDPDKAYPVVLMFHGIYANGPAFQSWFKMEEHVEGQAFVVYASSTADYWDSKNPAELTYFDELVKKLGDEYCINPANILAFGFSYGGYMASQLACKRAGYVKALSVGDGSWNGDVKCGRLPVLITHRTADTDEKVEWGRDNAKRWATYNKCATTTSITNAGMNCISNAGCKAPGSVSFCEDTYYNASWPVEWNHTVREEYRDFTWAWFKALP